MSAKQTGNSGVVSALPSLVRLRQLLTLSEIRHIRVLATLMTFARSAAMPGSLLKGLTSAAATAHLVVADAEQIRAHMETASSTLTRSGRL